MSEELDKAQGFNENGPLIVPENISVEEVQVEYFLILQFILNLRLPVYWRNSFLPEYTWQFCFQIGNSIDTFILGTPDQKWLPAKTGRRICWRIGENFKFRRRIVQREYFASGIVNLGIYSISNCYDSYEDYAAYENHMMEQLCNFFPINGQVLLINF